jgi:hypothetical protein
LETGEQIELQRASFLASARQQTKQFLRVHNNISPPVLHYQNLPQTDLGRKYPSYSGGETLAPRTTPVPSSNDYPPDSTYSQLHIICQELDSAIKSLTNIALHHVKHDKRRILTLNQACTSKAELRDRKPNAVRQSLTKITLNGNPSVTLDLPLQRAKTLPENIMKLVRSTSDVPQTRFRYRKSDSRTESLATSRPNGYQVFYHKEKERFKSKHSGDCQQFTDSATAKREKIIKRYHLQYMKKPYGDYGSSSCKHHLKYTTPNCKVDSIPLEWFTKDRQNAGRGYARQCPGTVELPL